MSLRPALCLLALALAAESAGAQTLTVSNGATLYLDGGGVLDLGAVTTLVETSGGRVTGGTGMVRAEQTLSSPASENVGGLGAEITSSANLGVTTVVRGHMAQNIGDGEGIARYYEISPATNSGLDATLIFQYQDSELRGLTETALALSRSADDGATWSRQGGIVDTAANTITLGGVHNFSRWTAAATIEQFVALAGQLLLEGPYNGTEMNTHLSNILPETDPYVSEQNVAPSFFSNDDRGRQVVDWIWLELRSGNPSDPPMSFVAQRAALLLADGSIVDTDGVSRVRFNGVAPDQYYLAVGHRSHLAIMSATALDCTSGTCSYDFTGRTAFGRNAQLDLSGTGAGPWASFAGDGDASGEIGEADWLLWLGRNGTAGYLLGDYNLSGGNTASDQALLLQNSGVSTRVPPVR